MEDSCTDRMRARKQGDKHVDYIFNKFCYRPQLMFEVILLRSRVSLNDDLQVGLKLILVICTVLHSL